MTRFFPLSKLRIVFLFLIALVVGRLYFAEGFPYTHDGENHLARFANYKVAIKEGQFPPRFAPNLMNHYGYPVFNYNYPLANILSLPFSLIKINYETTFKIIAIASVFLGLIGVNLWIKRLGFSRTAQSFCVLLFAFSPYLLQTIYYRGNVGEILALSILPWLFLSVEVAKEKSFRAAVFFIFVFASFFLAHNISVLFGTPCVLLYAALQLQKNWSAWKVFLISLLGGIGTTLWFWLPAVFEKSAIVVDGATLSAEYLKHFPTFHQLLFSPLEFGFSYVGSIDTNPFQVGLLSMLVLVMATIAALKVWWTKTRSEFPMNLPLLSLMLVLAWCAIFFQASFTAFIWQVIPFANFIQFPWRLSLFFSVFVLPLAAWVFAGVSTKGKLMLSILLILQIFASLRMQPVSYFHKDALTYENFPQSTSTGNENLPKDFTYPNIFDWQPQPVFLSGKGEVQVQHWNGTSRSYTVNVTEPSTIVEPTMNFLGWQTTITPTQNSGELKQATYINSDDIKGRIAYDLPTGEYQVTSVFTQKTWPRILGNTLTLLTLGALLGLTAKELRGKSINHV